jgi:hypothetical protein
MSTTSTNSAKSIARAPTGAALYGEGVSAPRRFQSSGV